MRHGSTRPLWGQAAVCERARTNRGHPKKGRCFECQFNGFVKPNLRATLMFVSVFVACGCSGNKTASTGPSSLAAPSIARARTEAVEACHDFAAVRAPSASSLGPNNVPTLRTDVFTTAVDGAAAAAKVAADADPTWVTFSTALNQLGDPAPSLTPANGEKQLAKLQSALALIYSTCEGLGLEVGP